MLIGFACGSCSARLETEASNAGTQMNCPRCGAALTVPPAAIGPGVTIAGFRIERLIGEGGMGRVYLARQLSMDRPVALKILPAAMAADAKIAERFVQEVRLTARLDHPHLVTAYEAGQDDGVLFFAMAYVNGRSLHELLIERGPMTELEALRVTLKLAHALAYAWEEHRLLHRDIKPANVLMDARGEPKLADLGLARTMSEAESGLTMAGTILGTPNYMSPEAAEGRRLDVRSDIYSLGATFWSMLTGHVPFDGEPLPLVLRKQVTENYPDVRAWNPAVSPATREILDRMLAKDPKQRFQSWAEVIAAIESALRPAESAAPRPPFISLLVVSALLLTALLLVVIRVTLRQRAAAPSADVTASGSQTSSASPVSQTPAESTTPAPPASPSTEPAPIPSSTSPNIASSLFEAARAYWRDHPEDRAGAIHRLREVARRFPHSPVAQRAHDLADRIERGAVAPPPGLMVTLTRLRREAELAMAQGNYEEVIRRLHEYRGPFEKETAEVRRELIKEARAALERQTSQRKEKARARFSEGVSFVADALLRGDRAAALDRLRALAADPELADHAGDAQKMLSTLESLPAVSALLVESFRSQRYEDVTLELKDGRTETFRILGVEPNSVRAQRELPHGFIEISISLSQLHPREVWRRLGTASSPDARIARGLYAAEQELWPAAAAEFEAAGGLLGAALADVARQRAVSSKKE